MASEMRILIVDDEAAIRETLRTSLLKEGFLVAEAASGHVGLEQATRFHPNIVLLDLGLPDLDGASVLKSLRKWTTIPIIILTATDDEKIKVDLLDAGADDYLTKPFGPRELLARIRVCLRNKDRGEATPVFESGDLRVDLSTASVQVGGKPIKLTTTEFTLLKILVREHGRVISQKRILKEVWESAGDELTHYVRIYIAQLRKKIEKDPSAPQHLLTEPGFGYRLI